MFAVQSHLKPVEPLPLPIEITDILLPGGILDFFGLVIAIQRDAQMLISCRFCLLDGQSLCPVLIRFISNVSIRSNI